MKQTPRLLRSELTDRVYVVTKYTIDPKSGLICSNEKFDVTDEFNKLAHGKCSCGDCAVHKTGAFA